MKSNEFFQLVRSGKQPIVRFLDNIYHHAEESVDPRMVGKVIGATQEYEDSYRFLIDLSGYEEYNKSVACRNWNDSNGEPKLTWFETSFYPKDGIEPVYLRLDIEIPMEIVEENSLLSEYVVSQSTLGYVEWLEEQINRLRLEKG